MSLFPLGEGTPGGYRSVEPKCGRNPNIKQAIITEYIIMEETTDNSHESQQLWSKTTDNSHESQQLINSQPQLVIYSSTIARFCSQYRTNIYVVSVASRTRVTVATSYYL